MSEVLFLGGSEDARWKELPGFPPEYICPRPSVRVKLDPVTKEFSPCSADSSSVDKDIYTLRSIRVMVGKVPREFRYYAHQHLSDADCIQMLLDGYRPFLRRSR